MKTFEKLERVHFVSMIVATVAVALFAMLVPFAILAFGATSVAVMIYGFATCTIVVVAFIVFLVTHVEICKNLDNQ